MWYTKFGKDGDVVLSTRVRLARNIKDIPFDLANLSIDVGSCVNIFSAEEHTASSRLAYSMKTRPSVVRTVSPFSLSNSLDLTVFSSSAIFWLTAGWVIRRTAAAFVKLRFSATAMNTFNLKSSNITSPFYANISIFY